MAPTKGNWREYRVNVDLDRVRLAVDDHEVLSFHLSADLMERVSPLDTWALELSRKGRSVHPSDALLRGLCVERENAEGGPPFATLSFRRDPNSDETTLRYLNFRVYADSCGLKTAFLGNGGRKAATIFSLRYSSSR